MVLTRKRRRCRDLKVPQPTCFTRDQLLELVKEWNRDNYDNKIVGNWGNYSKIKLWNALSKKYGHEHEDIWIKNKTRKNKLNESFAPVVPDEWNKKPDTWLSDWDLAEAMKSYVNRDKKFHFLYPAPIDFAEKESSGKCAHSNLCNYHYAGLARKYNKFAAIFNTDPHDEPGQHWISLFVDLRKGEICYYDSAGDPPPDEIRKLLNRFKEEGDIYFKKSGRNKKVVIKINRKKHQKGGTECGVYGLTFIHHMLTDGDFESFAEKELVDTDIIKLRGYFFDDMKGTYKKEEE